MTDKIDSTNLIRKQNTNRNIQKRNNELRHIDWEDFTEQTIEKKTEQETRADNRITNVICYNNKYLSDNNTHNRKDRDTLLVFKCLGVLMADERVTARDLTGQIAKT
jgi:hypothetical protein